MSLAASLTGLQIEYVDGVTEIEERLLPPGAEKAKLGNGALGAWRAHMNVARLIVEQNITSALVLEGDVDWDLRIKSQMQSFAKASRLLLQPGKGDYNFDATIDAAPQSTTSPYGNIDLWDVLWLGHCGSRLPKGDDSKVQHGRVVIPHDETVPEAQHIDFEFGGNELKDDYPDHTRIVSWSRANVCTLAYGISQGGAQRYLFQLGISRLNSATDLMFQQMCDGSEGRPRHNCLSVQPQLFQHHRAIGHKSAFSGISDHGDGYNKVAFTKNVRWSTRLNFEKLAYGKTDYVDLFRDGEPRFDPEADLKR
ncbi:hypothetical protein PRZ48_014404 [Zasmidium cellare]|uniref:Glycosyltransferase family 25 protein n=1 Tax=Zasmidium cellare TaxID=395010 RepID=A0ABR0DYM4_ZASCE|nr:hypothetical protein PRZ48_014404 [Zasmidium cellare]